VTGGGRWSSPHGLILLPSGASTPHDPTVAQKIGDHYSRVYAALRTLCGSRTMPYAACTGAVNAPGFPVIWHSWTDPDRGAYVCWSITDEERARRRSELAMLEEWACSPDQPSGGDS